MDITKDYYAILGLTKEASDEDIKTSFRKLAKQYHPDKNNGSKDAEQKFKEVNEAYGVLSDDEKKKQYDIGRTKPFGNVFDNSWSPEGNFEDIFAEAFSHYRPNKQRTIEQIQRKLQRRIKVPVMPMDVINGGEITFNFQRHLHNGTVAGVSKTFKIVKGMQDKMQLLFKDEGDQTMFSDSVLYGDLIVMIAYVLPSNVTLDESRNAHLMLPVPYYDIMLGGSIDVPLLEGGTATVKLKQFTDPDISLRLRGKGMPISVSGPRADMYVRLKPMLSRKENAKELELLGQIKSAVEQR